VSRPRPYGHVRVRSRRHSGWIPAIVFVVVIAAGCASVPSPSTTVPPSLTVGPGQTVSSAPSVMMSPTADSSSPPLTQTPVPKPAKTPPPGAAIDDPIAVDSLPFRHRVIAAAEPDWFSRCGTGRQVLRDNRTGQDLTWFLFRPAETLVVGAWASGTDYSSMVYAFDSPDATGLVACDDVAHVRGLRFEAKAGRQYLFGIEPAGRATRFELDVVPPPSQVTLTVDPDAVFYPDGIAISGTVSCSPDDPDLILRVHVTQPEEGRRPRIGGSSDLRQACTGIPQPWESLITHFEAVRPIVQGPATAVARASSCAEWAEVVACETVADESADVLISSAP
jgi:hypothetical protein